MSDLSQKELVYLLVDAVGSDLEKQKSVVQKFEEYAFCFECDESQELRKEIKETYDADNFELEGFIDGLVTLIIESQKARMDAFHRADEALEKLSLKEQVKNLLSFGETSEEDKEQEYWLNAQMLSASLFDLLGDRICQNKSAIIRLILDNQSYIAFKAMKKIGDKSSLWLEDLLNIFTSRKIFNNEYFDALAAAISEDTDSLRLLMNKFEDTPWMGRVYRAASYIGKFAKNDDRLMKSAFRDVELLSSRGRGNYKEEDGYENALIYSTIALSSMTSGTPEAIPTLLELTYHDEEQLQGLAISGLETVGFPSEKVVDRLVQLLSTFVEYDSDMYYFGAQSRVAGAIAAQGKGAAKAVPELLKHLKDEEGDVDISVVEALGAIGGASNDILPFLDEYMEDYDEEDREDESDPIVKAYKLIKADL